MANREHVDLLKHGAAEWNQWRSEHPETRLDLNEADLSGAHLIRANLSGATLRVANLSGADLSGADLRRATLSGAHLEGANLNEADLSGADLIRADLIRANLSGADLSGANLNEANLSGADLRRADLRVANLSGAGLIRANLSEANLSGTGLIRANLNEANLSGAILSAATLSGAILSGAILNRATFWNTILTGLDLRQTKGLIEIQHQGPSMIQLHSIQLPQDGSALHFLRNVGVPDEWIDFYRASMTHPIQYHSCFISYASDNEGIAKRLHADLQANGVRCWFAPHDLKPGDYFREEIDKAIHIQDKLLLILSEQSVASKWVRYEQGVMLFGDGSAQEERDSEERG